MAESARERIRPHVRRTPLEVLSDPAASDKVVGKCENLQITGSFKVRGAVAAMTAHAAAGIRHVIAASTGNHGAAVAYAGHVLGLGVTVFSPESADRSKLAAIRRWGAEVVRVPGDPVEAELTGRRAATSDSPYVSPYNDPDVIAGQGTIGYELLEQLPTIDTLVTAVGGGGLISGVAAVLKQARPNVRVVGASPVNSAVMLHSVARGEILDLESGPTLSDGTAGGVEPGARTFDLCRQLVDEWVTVDEDAIERELAAFVGSHHQLIEGAAAVALAAARQIGAYESGPGLTAVILCGANIASPTLAAVLGRQSSPPG